MSCDYGLESPQFYGQNNILIS